MTPQEKHRDAVRAAREWRDEQRGLPRRGDKLVIRWPGGHDFHMEFLQVEDHGPPHEPGWVFLHGKTGEHELGHLGMVGEYQTLYARPVEPGVWEMLPKLL